MTDLLGRATERRGTTTGPPGRPLAVSAAIAGAGSAAAVLTVCMALGLLGWFGSEAGSHGDTRDALRVGADAWLLAHGADLDLPTATISVVPLGLTLLCAYVTFRIGRWAGLTSSVADDTSVLLAAGLLACVYATVATLTALLASLEQARTHPGAAFAGGFVLALLAGGAGVLDGCGRVGRWRARAPAWVVAVVTGASIAALLLMAAGALLCGAALVADLDAGANVLARLHTGAWGGFLYTLVVASVVPNAALFGGSYLVGPGFVVGTGTSVSPSTVVLGPVPAFPLLAALPGDGSTPGWAAMLSVVPAGLAAVAVWAALRRREVSRYEYGGLLGVGAGALGGVLFGLLAAVSGGSVGPGRMRDVGAAWPQTMLEAGVAMGIGGLLAGLAVTWWTRRRGGPGDDPDGEDTVRLPGPGTTSG